MVGTKNIIWLASYPKSGNTWMRIFFSNLMSQEDKPVNINQLLYTPIVSSRDLFDEITGVSSSDLTFDEIDQLRPEVYKQFSGQANEIQLMKVHDAYRKIGNGNYLFPSDISKGVIYIIRNPLDVAVSNAHHSTSTYNRAIKNMIDPNGALCKKDNSLNLQIRQIMYSWSRHVDSWTQQKDIPTMIIKYEDMLTNAFETFRKAATFVGINTGDERIRQAIHFSRFEELQQQEKTNGFKERKSKEDLFFREGNTNSWKEKLSKQQISVIIDACSEVMKRYGYLK